MKSLGDLGDTLARLDGQSYRAYKSIAGAYRGQEWILHIDHVQGDPFAEPSRLRLVISKHRDLPSWSLRTAERRVATADFLHRTLHRVLPRASGSRGSGKSGALTMTRPGQQVIARSACSVSQGATVEVRLRAGLPAAGRRILGRQAREMLCTDLPRAVERGLLRPDVAALAPHVETIEDARCLREQLDKHGLVAFVANGASLARHSGVDDRPLAIDRAVRFVSPPSLEVTLKVPNAGKLCGLGVPRGVTLIVGGGYHGKSTLLAALERGIYDHIPGDGRQQVVTVPDAVKVRAEDGRRVASVDIANFIGNLPDGQDTRAFSTDNASGSTSQAAAIIEAIESGATCLLIDEDTSATNFMIRDARMQRLVDDSLEPITPFIDRARHLSDVEGVSTVLVVGGAGDYFDVADTIIAMAAFTPRDVTEEARVICHELPAERTREGGPWGPLRSRVIEPGSFDPRRGRRETSIKTWREDRVLYGAEEVDLAAVEQIVELAQTRAMAEALAFAHRHLVDGQRTLPTVVKAIMATLAEGGLDAIASRPTGELAAFRSHELAAFINRLRSLRIR